MSGRRAAKQPTQPQLINSAAGEAYDRRTNTHELRQRENTFIWIPVNAPNLSFKSADHKTCTDDRESSSRSSAPVRE